MERSLKFNNVNFIQQLNKKEVNIEKLIFYRQYNVVCTSAQSAKIALNNAKTVLTVLSSNKPYLFDS